MKKQFLIIITGLLIITSSVFAQNKDHALIGHLEGADLWYQNIYNINEYTVITGALKKDSLTSSIKVTGKTTMTTYKYKGDNSAFGIIHNYTDFLKNNGFEILLSCKGSECGGDIAKNYIKLNLENETLDNLHAWRSRYFKNYLSAQKIENEKTIYVCIYIAQGWWSHPVYRIDVVEKTKQTNMIINNNDHEVVSKDAVQQPSTNKNTTNAMTSNVSEIKNTQAPLFSFQIGMGSYNFYDPSLYGQNTVFQTNDAYSSEMSGFKDLSGPYFKAVYYFNENIGIVADLAFHSGEGGSYIENATSYKTYETSAELNFQRIGIVGRFIGERYPVKLSFSSGFGRGSLETYYMIKTETYEVHYEGETDFPMVFFQTELQIPLFKGLFFFSEYEYTVGWSEDFYMDHDGGSEYSSIKYKYPGFGGNNFRIGLGYEFSKNQSSIFNSMLRR